MKSWQEDLFKHSLMKKEKVRLIRRHYNFAGKEIFDLGCASGAVTFQLKKGGGLWVHADLDLENLKNARSILGQELFKQGENHVPLRSGYFDCVVALDYLEHIHSEDMILEEIVRILKPRGQLILSTPVSGGFFILNWLKGKLGLNPEIYGHKREGYSLTTLSHLLHKHNFRILLATTYAKFFVEFFEVLLNALFIRMKRGRHRQLRTGSISPSSEKELKSNSGLMELYKRVIYPVVRMLTWMDVLLGWKKGYATLVIAQRK